MKLKILSISLLLLSASQLLSAQTVVKTDSTTTMTGTPLYVNNKDSQGDSVKTNEDTRTYNKFVKVDDTHVFKPKQLILPLAFGAVGLFGVYNDWLKDKEQVWQNSINKDTKHKTHIDDYLQFSPIVGAYALNLCGVKGQHDYKDLTIISAMAYLIAGGGAQLGKWIFHEKRPDLSDNSSFPSGHTTIAFTGATILWEEYKDTEPWIGYIGFGAATLTGALRVYNNKHYIHDVVAGAGVGILGAKMAYWLYPVLFHHNTKAKKESAMHIVGAPFVGNGGGGCNAVVSF